MEINSSAQRIKSPSRIREAWKMRGDITSVAIGFILNPNTPTDILEKAWRSLPRDPFVDQATITHNNATTDLIDAVGGSSNNPGTIYLAQNVRTTK